MVSKEGMKCSRCERDAVWRVGTFSDYFLQHFCELCIESYLIEVDNSLGRTWFNEHFYTKRISETGQFDHYKAKMGRVNELEAALQKSLIWLDHFREQNDNLTWLGSEEEFDEIIAYARRLLGGK